MIKNSKIVLTGASSGIGFEMLKMLADPKNGNTILTASRTAEEKLGNYADNVIAFNADTGSKEDIDAIFAKAEEVFDKIDIFIANAGFPYYEKFDYVNYDKIDKIFRVNVFGPIYSYQKYLEHLNGRDGKMAITASAMGTMAMPGYTLYTATKFALNGFQEALYLEIPKNIKLTTIYPVATNTNFFNVGNSTFALKPFPVQDPVTVAKASLKGIEKGAQKVSPCKLFDVSKVLTFVFPPVKKLYWWEETLKFKMFLKESQKANPKQSKKVY
ncbi:MAG: SDR family NAD(P)-dependent oxidoreductase [Acutalibacteraceae bacterium]|nr:SDR family NAD(P)-dependent oxidoreductase [Acutalibacteraceae bacterium]